MTSKENTSDNSQSPAKIKILSDFVLNSFPPGTYNNSALKQGNSESPSNKKYKSHNIHNEVQDQDSDNSSETIDYDVEDIIEYNTHNIPSENEFNAPDTSNENTMSSEDEGTVEFNYLTGAYEKVKRIKVVNENEANSNHNNSIINTHQKRRKRTRESKLRYKCFHCSFKINSKELLKYHALKLHHKQHFKCNLHSIEAKKCSKCLYQKILTNLKGELLICDNCGFKTCRDSTFKRHLDNCSLQEGISKKESSDDNGGNLSDSEEEYFPFKNDSEEKKSSKISLGALENHKNVDSQTLQKNDNSKILPVNDNVVIIIDDDDSNNETLSIANNYPTQDDNKTQTSEPQISKDKDLMGNFIEQNYDFICYDCPFKTFMNPNHLTDHAKSHPQSTFICHKHGLFKIFCKRCIYQYTLMSIKMKKLICKYCPKIFENLDSALIHMRGNCKEELNSTDYIMCYDCGFRANSRQDLFKHANCHRSNYQCFEHEQQKLKSCSKCLYEFLVKSLYKCLNCDCSGIKSVFELRSHIETKHLNNTYHPQIKCQKHLQSNNSCRQCVLKQICDAVYLKKICPICKSGCTFLKHHVNTVHKNIIFHCQMHKDKKAYGKCDWCYVEKISEARESFLNCCQCDFRCNFKEEFELHIVTCHSLEGFMCSRHSLGDIQSDCDMCAYETMVVKLSE